MTNEKLYTVTFRNYPNYEQYVYAETARKAIEAASDELWQQGYITPYLAPRVRPAVYKEWNNRAEQYRNDGSFTR